MSEEKLIIKINEFKILIPVLSSLPFLYFTRSSFINFAKAIGVGTTIMAAVVMLSFLALLIYYTLKYKKISLDGLVLILFAALFFYVTLKVHPEYGYRFLDIRANGRHAATNMFSLGAAIYSYYVIRLFKNNYQKLYNVFCVIPYFILFLNIWTLLLHMADQEYKMDFGYQMAFAAILFLSQYLMNREKTKHCLWLSIISISLGIFYGSRACIIGYVVFVFCFFLWKGKLSNRQIILFVLAIMALILVNSPAFMSLLNSVLESAGLHSRTISLIATGVNLSYDRARMDRIWPVLMEALKNSSLFHMYGAFGDRVLIADYYAYAHNFILEILLTFGKFFGGIFLLWMFVNFIKTIFKEKDESGLLILIFGCFSICRLMVSSTFWEEPYFWALIAMLVNIRTGKKKNI